MNKTIVAAAALALGVSAGGAAQAFEIEEAGLTIGVTPTISSDYLFRGISQTRNRPAVQGTIDIAHSSGFYVGAFASNVAFLGTNARQEIDALAGYRFVLNGLNVDLGGIAYTYPGYRKGAGFNLTYFELAAKLSYEIPSTLPVKLLGSFNWSPDYTTESGNGYYVEGGVELSLPLDFTLAGRVGHQWIENNFRFGAKDYTNWNVTLSYKFSDFVLTAGYFDTSLSRSECFGGQAICNARGMVYLSRTF